MGSKSSKIHKLYINIWEIGMKLIYSELINSSSHPNEATLRRRIRKRYRQKKRDGKLNQTKSTGTISTELKEHE